MVHAPLFGPGSNGPADPKPAHLWAFRPPQDLRKGRWETWKIDETLTVLHGLHVADLDLDCRLDLVVIAGRGRCRCH